MFVFKRSKNFTSNFYVHLTPTISIYIVFYNLIELLIIQNFVYNILTATNLIYTIGAGITAAAGTMLAHQSFIKILNFYLLTLLKSNINVLLQPHLLSIGYITRLLPSLNVVAISKASSPESNTNSP